MQLMMRTLLIVVVLTHQALACLWDRDTVAEEVKGRPELAKLIVGWFDRFPPTYYQMRLERVTKAIEGNPRNLDLYDDAGVACDRLGRSNEAIAWMARKKSVLDSMSEGDSKDHRYRYLANLGTFHAHRWVLHSKEIREADLSDLRQSEQLIAAAIKDNPDAHFGREIYQLLAIRWLLWDGNSPIKMDEEIFLTFDETHWVRTMVYESNEPHSKGISGLIQLGAAWQSPDAFRSLAAVLDSEKLASLAELAYLREKELVSSGKASIHPVARVREQIHPGSSRFLEDPKPVRDYFPIARAAADRRNAAWIAYQEERFAKGMHPDTHPDFWNAWVEPAFPRPPKISPMQRFLSPRGGIMIVGFLAGAGLLAILTVRFMRRMVAG